MSGMESETKETTLNQIESFVRQLIEGLAPLPETSPGVGRPRIIPALCLWAGVIVGVLRGWGSQLAIWRLLSQSGLWDYPKFAISDQAIYKRLEQDGSEPFRELFSQVSAVLRERLEPYAQQQLARFATQVVAIDATTLDPLARLLPLLRSLLPGDRQLLPGKLAAIFDLRLQQWRYLEHIENPDENDHLAARSLLAQLQRGALILADLGYFGFAWFDQLTQEGYHWLSRLRHKTSYDILHVFYQQGDTFDGLIWLGAYRADRARYAVRLVTFRVGGTLYQYLTNVTNPRLLSLRDIAVLYARRWDIEMAFKLIKRELGLHLFWSAKTCVVLQQVWAVLTIAQILHALQLEIAGKAGVDPFDVSLPLLVAYLPRYHELDFIDLIVHTGRQFGFIRPSRRIRIQTPPVDLAAYQWPPPALVLTREPRYAGRRATSRKKTPPAPSQSIGTDLTINN
jgi:hypothetical protein